MAKFIVQLRRGTKTAWEDYEQSKPEESKPRDGEIVVEDDNGTPRLKIGNGETPYSDLPYMSVDSFVMPKPIFITLHGGAAWTEESEDRYSQDITEQLKDKITVNSKIDLQPTPEQLCQFHTKDVTFTTVNNGGNVKVYAVGVRPEQDYGEVQVTITEVVNTTGSIIGNTTATPNPLPEVDQTYSAESENAQSGKAVAEAILNATSGHETDIKKLQSSLLHNLSIWAPLKEYKENDYVLSVYDVEGETALAFLGCVQAHTSGNYESAFEEENFNSLWYEADAPWLRALASNMSEKDYGGNIIHTTYARKDEVVKFLGFFDTDTVVGDNFIDNFLESGIYSFGIEFIMDDIENKDFTVQQLFLLEVVNPEGSDICMQTVFSISDGVTIWRTGNISNGVVTWVEWNDGGVLSEENFTTDYKNKIDNLKISDLEDDTADFGIVFAQWAANADMAAMDSEQNVIHEHYATKEEISDVRTDIRNNSVELNKKVSQIIECSNADLESFTNMGIWFVNLQNVDTDSEFSQFSELSINTCCTIYVCQNSEELITQILNNGLISIKRTYDASEGVFGNWEKV